MPVQLSNLPKPNYFKLFKAFDEFLVEKALEEVAEQAALRKQAEAYGFAVPPTVLSYEKTREALYYAQDISRNGIKRNGKKTSGLRKDGITPEFQHQLEICHLICTLLPWLEFPAETLTVALLHDVTEDYLDQEAFILETFGESVLRRVQILNKYLPDGTPKAEAVYFAECANDPVTSIVKPVDNCHNQSTMYGVFTLPKIYSYVKRSADHILPLMKVARRKFLKQTLAYENLKFLLRNQCQMAIATLNAAGFEPADD